MRSSCSPEWINEPWVSPRLRAWIEITMAATPGNVGLDEPGTIDKYLDTNTLTRASQTVHRENICIADQETVEAFARVLTADPTAAQEGLVVRPLQGTHGLLNANVTVQMQDVDVTAAAPLAVRISDGTDQVEIDGSGNLQVVVGAALPAGDNNIGNVDIVTMPSDDTDDDAVAGGATAPRVIGLGYGYDGAQWERLATDGLGSLDVNVTLALPAGDNNIGNVDIVTLPDEGQQNMAGSISVAIASDQSAIEVVGDVAHDSPVGGNPLQLAGEARSTSPTAVGSGDVVRLMADLLGKQVILPFANPENFVENLATLTTTGDVSILSAAGVGIRNYVTEVTGSNTSGTAVRVDIKDGTTTKRSFYVAASGGGFVWSGPNYVLRSTANTAVQAALSAAVTDVRVGASGYTAP